MQNYGIKLKKQNKSTCANVSLDTLAQVSCSDKQDLKLTGRARSKYITNHLVYQLVNLESPLKKSYWNTYHCNNIVFVENGNIHTKYCKNRWCLQCNRIKTATFINAYNDEFQNLEYKKFVTLTIPNVKKEDLINTINDMYDKFKIIRKRNYFKKNKLKGMRKIEITYNPVTNEYHPHFHLIVSGEEVAEYIVNSWLNLYPSANKEAQNITDCDDNTIIELLKYVTKFIEKDKKTGTFKVYIKALDVIFQSLKGRRTFQTYGIKKQINEEEDFNVFLQDKIDIEQNYEWEQEICNWIGYDFGDLLIEYELTDNLKELARQINPNSKYFNTG